MKDSMTKYVNPITTEAKNDSEKRSRRITFINLSA